VVTVLEEEGAEIINANFSVVGRKIFYTIHSRVYRPFSIHFPLNLLHITYVSIML
jgi:hypothetical protein